MMIRMTDDYSGDVYVFDLDGTLVRNVAFRQTIFELPRIVNLGVDPNIFYEEFLKTYYSTVARGNLPKAFDWEYISEQTCRRFGSSYKYGIFTHCFLRNIDDGYVQLIPGASEVLKTLRGRGAKIVVLTNGRRVYQERVLRRTGLHSFIDLLITLDDVPKPKPYPEAFDTIYRTFRSATIHFVGDHPFYDVYAAANYCIPNIYWFTENIPAGEYSFSQILKYISDIARTKYGWELSPKERAFRKKIYVINSLAELIKYSLSL